MVYNIIENIALIIVHTVHIYGMFSHAQLGKIFNCFCKNELVHAMMHMHACHT